MENQNSHERIPVLGLTVDLVSVPRAVEISEHYLKNDYFNFVLLAGSRLAMESQEDEASEKFVQRADLILPGDHNIEKAIGHDYTDSFQERYLDQLLTKMASHEAHICILCDSEEQAEEAVLNLMSDYPGLNVNSAIYDKTEEEDLEKLVNTINGFFPELVLPLVSLEKQQELILKHSNMLSTKMFVGSRTLSAHVSQEDKTDKESSVIVKWFMKRMHIGQEAIDQDFWAKFQEEQEAEEGIE